VSKKSPPQLYGRLFIRKSVGGERRALIRIIAFKYFYFFCRALQRFGVFTPPPKKINIFERLHSLLDCCRCVVELNNTKCTFSPNNAFDTGNP